MWMVSVQLQQVCVGVLEMYESVLYIQVFVYCPHPSMCACHYKGIQVHTRVCAHTSVCAQVGWKGHVPSSTSVYECKQQPKWRWGVLKWRSWCTVIRFQWGHRRIRRGPGKVLTWLRAARACSTCHLVSSDLSEVAPFGFIDDRRVRMLVLKH